MAGNSVFFDEKFCKGCLLCVASCPQKILEQDTERVNSSGYNPVRCVDPDKCTACTMCARICPDSVITVKRGVS